MNSNEPSRANTLNEQIDKRVSEMEFSGVVSVHERGSAIYRQAFGYRDIKNKCSNDLKTRFGIASGTKFFTALGIGALIDQHQLSFDTPLKSIGIDIGSFVDGDATIRSLLTHTSGIYDYYDEEVIEDFETHFVAIPWYHLKTPSDYYPLFEKRLMKFPANTRYSYSNGGYVFLGIIIEKLTGYLYRDFIFKNVFQPANMNHSGFFSFNNLPENTANGYLEDKETTNIYNLPSRGGGDGGMYSTIEDLRSFWQSLFSFKILSQDITMTFLQKHVRIDNVLDYCCGVYKKRNQDFFFISGSDAGVGFESIFLPKRERVINILSNVTNGQDGIREVIFDSIE